MRKWLLILALTSCTMPGSPDPGYDELKAKEWQIAQDKLTQPPWNESRAYDVSPWHVNWREHEGTFDCGGVEANGCYKTQGGGTVIWNTLTPTVIRHEAGHAILHKLGRKDWKCYEHGCN
jgi:hypothetical protein